jgi:hypothetical protein
MKLHALGASAVALALAFTSPAQADVNKTDKAFILLTTATIIQATMCSSYDIVDGSTRKYADMNGADFDNLKGPVMAAINAQIGREYDRAELIPEVTQIVRSTFNEMGDDFDRNKQAACSKWGKILVSSGLMKRK